MLEMSHMRAGLLHRVPDACAEWAGED